ncbi:hypothetical protein KH5_08230 [Urechidicola sp. KH5]
MLKPIKKLLERNAYVVALFLTLLITYLSLSSLSDLPVKISTSDKILHGFAYFALSLSWFFAIKNAHFSFKYKIVIALSVIFYGVIIEVFQEQLTENRMMDFFDVIANTIGVLIAFSSFNFLLKVYKTI